MNKLLILLAFPLFFSCGNTPSKTDTEGFLGEKFDASSPISMADLYQKLAEGKPITAVVTSPISSVCQVKGCWMTLKNEGKEDVRITFKDYAFFVPKDCTGKTAIIQGTATMDTTSVAELRHYAEDDGQSKEEIEKITEPKVEMVFEASGVLLK